MIIATKVLKLGAGIAFTAPDGSIYRYPLYEGTRPAIFNFNTFERVYFKEVQIWVGEAYINEFSGMVHPTKLCVYEMTIMRPPFPENVASGRDNGFTEHIFIEDAAIITQALNSFSPVTASLYDEGSADSGD